MLKRLQFRTHRLRDNAAVFSGQHQCASEDRLLAVVGCGTGPDLGSDFNHCHVADSNRINLRAQFEGKLQNLVG